MCAKEGSIDLHGFSLPFTHSFAQYRDGQTNWVFSRVFNGFELESRSQPPPLKGKPIRAWVGFLANAKLLAITGKPEASKAESLYNHIHNDALEIKHCFRAHWSGPRWRSHRQAVRRRRTRDHISAC
jgi:hypothetical protein